MDAKRKEHSLGEYIMIDYSGDFESLLDIPRSRDRDRYLEIGRKWVDNIRGYIHTLYKLVPCVNNPRSSPTMSVCYECNIPFKLKHRPTL